MSGYLNEMPGLFDSLTEGDDEPLHSLDPVGLERGERLRFISFGSGSSGNCAYLGTSSCGVLIDAGVDNNFVAESLKKNSINMRSICGILLTHDHGDHVRYAYPLLRRNPHLRLYATPKAMTGILRRHSVSRRIKDYHNPIYKEFPFKAGDFGITAFETSHDGTDNCGFYIEGAGTSFAVVTDTGIITERADYYIRRSEHLMLEANYDAEMLRKGSYPQHLKARILSERGHLDNIAGAVYLAGLRPEGLRNVFLCHLSQDNNTPETARRAYTTALRINGIEAGDGSGSAEDRSSRLRLHVLPRTNCSPLIYL